MNDDSDGDEADQLSPTDGYFTANSSSNGVPRVPNVMVTDPTLQQSETDAESKAREADQERLLSTSSRHAQVPPGLSSRSDYSANDQSTVPSTRSYSITQPTHTSSTSYAPSSSTAAISAPASRNPLPSLPSRGRTASLYSEAPPAYTPSSSSPLSPASPSNQARNYGGTTSTTTAASANMGVEDERLLGRDPESMADPDDEEVRRPVWSRRMRRRLPLWLNSWRMLILGVVLLFVTVGFLASTYRVFKGDGGSVSSTLDFPTPPSTSHLHRSSY